MIYLVLGIALSIPVAIFFMGVLARRRKSRNDEFRLN
jgi:uncharacterized membrane protein